jgi:hypothetical protein
MNEGDRIDQYRLVRPIARGGMGEVWEAEPDGDPQPHIAVKMLRADHEEDPARLRKFIEEARIGATLNHPNVVRLLDLGHEGGRIFLAMELLQGVTLAQVLRANRDGVPVGAAVELARQALDGLDHIHNARSATGESLGLVHRDVKPSNLFLTQDGVVKIIDFGIATAGSLDPTRTETGRLRGSLRYFSPEQARNEPLDGRTDLFGLALVLHELLTGKPVFDQDQDAQVLSAVLFGAIPSVRMRRKDVPERLEAVVASALQRDPAARPATARAFKEAIDGAVSGDEAWNSAKLAAWSGPRAAVPVERQTGTFDPALGPPPPAEVRHPRRARIPLVLGFVLCVAGVAAFLALRQPAAEPPLAPPEAATPPAPMPSASLPIEAAPPPVVASAPPEVALPAPTPGAVSPSAEPKRRVRAAPAVAAVREGGWVSGQVAVDGHDVGPTPVFRHRLAAGAHRIEVVRSDGKREVRRVRIVSGQEEKTVIDC